LSPGQGRKVRPALHHRPGAREPHRSPKPIMILSTGETYVRLGLAPTIAPAAMCRSSPYATLDRPQGNQEQHGLFFDRFMCNRSTLGPPAVTPFQFLNHDPEALARARKKVALMSAPSGTRRLSEARGGDTGIAGRNGFSESKRNHEATCRKATHGAPTSDAGGGGGMLQNRSQRSIRLSELASGDGCYVYDRNNERQSSPVLTGSRQLRRILSYGECGHAESQLMPFRGLNRARPRPVQPGLSPGRGKWRSQKKKSLRRSAFIAISPAVTPPCA